MIKDNFAFPKSQANAHPSSGDAGPGGIVPSGELPSHDALGDTSAHGDVSHYRTAQAASSGINADGGSAGMGLAGAVDNAFSTYGDVSVNGDAGASGYGVGGSDGLVIRNDLPSADSNFTAGGRAVGG